MKEKTASLVNVAILIVAMVAMTIIEFYTKKEETS